MLAGFDVSKWQTPSLWDWPALRALNEASPVFIIARATYGSGQLDKHFVEYAQRCKDNGIMFGAYHFYRQTQSVEAQLGAFQKQIDAIGGLHAGNLFPVLDMESNAPNGDGSPNAKVWNRACDEIGDAWKKEYGGCILYYSSYFPDMLGAHKGDTGWHWMKEPGYLHWLADYSVKDGAPRHPYTPDWNLHQPKPRATKLYMKGGAPVDTNFLNGSVTKLLIPPGHVTPGGDLDPGIPPIVPECDDGELEAYRARVLAATDSAIASLKTLRD